MSEMSFGSLVRELNAVKAPEKVKITRSASAEPTFAVSLQSYPDIVITRETPKVRKHLILMPTQSMYYIKTETVSGKGEPETVKIDADKLSAFCHGCHVHFNDFWFDRLPNGKKEAEILLKYLHREGVTEMLKYKACPDLQYENIDSYSRYGLWQKIETAYKSFKVCPSLYKDYSNNERFRQFVQINDEVITDANERWGASGVRTLIQTVINSLVDVSATWCTHYYSYRRTLDNMFMHYNMDMQTAVDYMCYTSVQMGYADTMHNFFRDWQDCLDMQNRIYGKIREKYPDDLPTMHQRLAYLCRVNQEQINMTQFAKQHEKTVKYEWQYNGYVFIAPTQPKDFRDEATQQANCLAGYINRYADGLDHIVFMRYASTPEKSLITIELSADEEPRLLQAYRARNTDPTPEQWAVINAWLKHIKEEI